VNRIDPYGREPIKPFAGTVGGFVRFMNGLSTGICTSTGAVAHAAMLRMGMTNGIKPANTAPHSAYSYEDLSSDKFGADFGANYFDPNSKQTFSEQIQNYIDNVLKATSHQNAPNYNSLPNEYPDKPTRTNKTTKPVYVNENP